MRRVFAIARHPATRVGFLLGALGLAVWAITRDWARVTDAFSSAPLWAITVALVLSAVYVLATMQSWRSVMADLGVRLGWTSSAHIFLVGQLGKYIPGGVWNVVAGAELAKDRGIPRARSASALGLTMLISAIVGVSLAGVAAVAAPHGGPGWVRLLGIATPVALVALAPRVLTALLNYALKMARRPVITEPLSGRAIFLSAAWALAAWVLAGVQLWVLAIGLEMTASVSTALLAIGGFAAAWLVGLAVLFTPAGLGARELVLFPILANHLDTARIIAVVVLSRVLFTVVDVALALIPLATQRFRKTPSRS